MNEFVNHNSGNILFTVLAAIVLGTLLAFYISRNLHEQAMADKGYVEQALPGTTNTIWVKDNGCY